MKKIMHIKEAAKHFGFGRDKMSHMVKTQPDIPIILVNGKPKINATMFCEWLDLVTREGRKL